MQLNPVIYDRGLTGMHRKPESWDEVGLPIGQDALDTLPLYTAEELGIANNISATFSKKIHDTFFRLTRRGGLYLIATGGCDYVRNARYVGLAPTPPAPEWEPGKDFDQGDDTLEYVIGALITGGYGISREDYHSCVFSHVSETGKEVHLCIYENDSTDELEAVMVFVWMKDGKLVADF